MTISPVASYIIKDATQPFHLIIAHGSVVDFVYPANPSKSAIVNAANEACLGLGEGGVDGAVSTAGGSNLLSDRMNLPPVYGVRCFTGRAVMTGPNNYDTLAVPYVIHAVGPNYSTCDANDEESMLRNDQLLYSAYASSMECGQRANLEAVAFCLLSAGDYRGARGLRNVLRIGLNAISEFEGYEGLKVVYICGCTSEEVTALITIADEIGLMQQLAATNTQTKRVGKLEVIDDGIGDECINPPVPIEEQLAAAETEKGGKVNNVASLENEGIGLVDLQRMVTPVSVAAGLLDDTAQRRTNSALPPSARKRTWINRMSSRQMMTDDEIEQPEEAVVAEASSDPPPPLLEATLVDDIVYDAVAVRPSWWKRQPKVAVCGVLLVTAVVVAAVSVPSIVLSGRIRKQNSANQQGDDIIDVDSTPEIDNVPIKRDVCFTTRDKLDSAIERYLTTEDCPNNRNCDVGKEYGWPMESWCVSNIQDMSYLFSGQRGFTEDISGWDVSSVTDMNGMFYNASTFNVHLSSWDVSSVTNMSEMFYNATAFKGDLSSWNVSSVSEMSNMFYQASSFSSDLSSWNVSSVTNMYAMFGGATSFNGDLSSWNVSSVTNMYAMFYGATSFNGDLSSWDVSSVTDMSFMFFNAASFNGDLSSWDVSSVTTPYAMFEYTSAFSSDLSSWNVSSVTDMSFIFYNASAFNGNISSWNVSSVSDMIYMFSYATSFNGDLSSWDVSSVSDMSYMFYYATAFNGDLSSWDVSSVADMTSMFEGASSFNQDLCDWVDQFPYQFAANIFAASGCTFQSQPSLDQQGPFCASSSCLDTAQR
ncbi:hypothetical protein ACHAWU_005885 [Discostella pseudostelligera]|uniref:Macro domain-containing protein n=1 Tax=Discostella pseudostelligera TaxID=259834 RepID=A0ABD3N1T1_9STRA